MKQFLNINDVADLNALLNEALKVKANPYSYSSLGLSKAACLIFLNPSLRTRLSSQRAAHNLGLHTVVLDIDNQGWKIEFEDGTIMNGESAEHIKEAAVVIGSYFEIVAIRAFAKLKNRDEDYSEQVLNAFAAYCPAKIINMESPTAHPLQAFADLITISENKKVDKPKVVLTWAPHPKALPQAVANSFVRWMQKADLELVVTHPEGYELNIEIMNGLKTEYDQEKAFENADFIYAKNWSSYSNYGKVISEDFSWMVTQQKMERTNGGRFLHCLPARRNVIVEDSVLDSDKSLVIEQAQNRVFAMQTVLKLMLET